MYSIVYSTVITEQKEGTYEYGVFLLPNKKEKEYGVLGKT